MLNGPLVMGDFQKCFCFMYVDSQWGVIVVMLLCFEADLSADKYQV